MKKVLFGTSALVAATMLVAAPASAAEKISLSLGGYAEQWIGYSSNDVTGVDHKTFDTKSDNEIYFTGSTKLESGISVSYIHQMETDRSGAGGVDETYLKVGSDAMGELRVGNTKHVSAVIAHDAPDVGMGNVDGDIPNWIANNTTAATDPSVGDDDSNKVAYYSPRFGGLGLAASYSPDHGSFAQGVIVDKVAGTAASAAYGLVFNGDLGGVSVGADVGQHQTGDTSKTTRVGFNASTAGFTLGASYAKVDDKLITDTDDTLWSVGVSYSVDAYSVSASYFTSDEDNTNDEVSTWMVSGSYAMGPGIALKGSVFGAEYDDGVAANDNDGFGIVTGLKVSF